MARTTFGLALAFSLLVAGSAFADSFTFTSAGSTTWNGVYVNPYTAHDNTQSQDLTIYCDDWNTDFSGNPTWTGNVYALTAANLPNFKFGNTTQNYSVTLLANNDLSAALSTTPPTLTRYLEAAWLDEQWQNALTQAAISHTTPDATVQKELAAAVWTLFVDTNHVGDPLGDPSTGLIGAINSSGFGPSVFSYLQQAEAAVAGGYTAAGWDVIVPDANGAPMQEFLVHAPEPGAVILLGTLVGLLAFAKFRRSVQA